VGLPCGRNLDVAEKRKARRRFSVEFKRDGLELVRVTGRLIAEGASDLGI
jgi:transposase-like protein